MSIDKSKLRKILLDVSENKTNIDSAVLLVEKLEKESEDWKNEIENVKKDINLSKACRDSKEFFNDIDTYMAIDKIKTDEGDPTWDDVRSTLTFPAGERLSLNVVVKDIDASQYLFRWLYNNDENDESLIPFGCELEEIKINRINDLDRDEKKKQLIDIINSL